MSLCERCQSKGLPIYPVRYAVAPNYTQVSLPKWAERGDLPKLSKQSNYVLRTMRKGYLYLISQYDLEKELTITVYKVDENGRFWLQDISRELMLLSFKPPLIDENYPIPLNDMKTGCESPRHSSANITFIVIEKAEQCETAWLAFSEHRWSKETLTFYLNSEANRNLRMQQIKPKQWLTAQQRQNGVTVADEESVAATTEMVYLDDAIKSVHSKLIDKLFISSTLFPLSYPYLETDEPRKEQRVSKSELISEPFAYSKVLLSKRSTLSPWPVISPEIKKEVGGVMGTKYSTYLSKNMQVTGEGRNSSGCPPMMVALMDSIGIAAELSCWGSNAIYTVNKVINERERENAAFSGIELLEEVIKSGDYAENEHDFYRHIKRENSRYLAKAGEYCRDNFIGDFTLAQSFHSIPWSDEERAAGKRVLGIYEQSKSTYISTYYDSHKIKSNSVKYDAKSLINYIDNNYLIKVIGETEYSRVFESIFALEDDTDGAKITHLSQSLSVIKEEITLKAQAYKAQWHKNNGTARLGEKRWQKYANCLNSDYEGYKKGYAQFLQEADLYVSDLIDDLLCWTCCLNQKAAHPLSLAADDLARDSDNYLAFANDILMTLNLQFESEKITDFFANLIEDSSLSGHNILWSAVFWGRKLDKAAQRNCVSFLLSLNKEQEMSHLTYPDLLERLSTVIHFYEGSSAESEVITQLASEISTISQLVTGEPNKVHPGINTADEILTLLSAERNRITDDNSEPIYASYIKPIRESMAASIMPLLRYLKKIGGRLSSEFAQAWFVASMPGSLSQAALNELMQSYYQFINQLKASMSYNMDRAGHKMASAYQNLATITKTTLAGQGVGSAIISGLLLYQLYSIYTLLSDTNPKTKAQQDSANVKLAIAASTTLSLCFRMAVTLREKGEVSDAILSRFKFTGNLFGFLSGLIKATTVFDEEMGDKSAYEKGLFWVSSGAEFIGTVDLFFQLGKTSLVEFLKKKLILSRSVFSGASKIVGVKIFLGRMLITIVRTALNPWVNLGLFLFQLAIELNRDDDIEIWLTRCRFGKAQLGLHDDYRNRYQSLKEEIEALKAIFEKFRRQAEALQSEQDEIKADKRQKEIESMVSPYWQNLNNNMRF